MLEWAWKIALAALAAYVILRIGLAMLGAFARPMAPPPPEGEMRRVKLHYRCGICGLELRVERATEELPPPPRHCQEDMDLVARECSFVTGRTVAHGGAGDSSVLTAYGVFQGMRAAAEVTWGEPTLRGRTVGVAGVGKVGHHLVSHLVADGAEVVVTDVSPHAVARVRAMPEGAARRQAWARLNADIAETNRRAIERADEPVLLRVAGDFAWGHRLDVFGTLPHLPGNGRRYGCAAADAGHWFLRAGGLGAR